MKDWPSRVWIDDADNCWRSPPDDPNQNSYGMYLRAVTCETCESFREQPWMTERGNVIGKCDRWKEKVMQRNTCAFHSELDG